MSEIIIIIDRSEVREGKLKDLKKAMNELVEFVKANEPGIISYNMYLDKSGTTLTVMQVHPDSASAEYHMEVAGSAFPKLVELIRMLGIDVYGSPSQILLERLRRNAQMLGSEEVIVHEPLAGFARFEVVSLRPRS